MKIGDRLEAIVSQAIKLIGEIPDNGYMGFDGKNRLVQIDSSEFYEAIIPILELAIKYQKDQETQYFLGIAQSSLAEGLNKADREQERQAELLEKAISNFKEAMLGDDNDDDEVIPDYHYQLGRAYFDLAEITQDYNERRDNLSMAMSNLILAVDNSGVNSNYTHYLGRAIYCIAEDAQDVEERRKLMERAIGYFEKAVELDGSATDYFWLGEAQSDLAEETADYDEKRDMFEEAIRNLQKSYDMDRDDRTLDRMAEIKEDLGIIPG